MEDARRDRVASGGAGDGHGQVAQLKVHPAAGVGRAHGGEGVERDGLQRETEVEQGPALAPDADPEAGHGDGWRQRDRVAGELDETDGDAGNGWTGLDPGVVGLQPHGDVAGGELHALTEAQRDAEDVAGVLGDADAEAAVDGDGEVGAGQVVEQAGDTPEEVGGRADGGVERVVVLQHDAAQQLLHGRAADRHGEQVLDRVLGECDRRRQGRDDLGQRARHRGGVGLRRRRVLEHGELHGGYVEQPLRGEATGAVEVEPQLDPPATGGRGAGEHREHRTELDRTGGDRRRADDDGQVVDPARGERQRGIDPVHGRDAGGRGGDLEPARVRLPTENDRAHRHLERLADGLDVDVRRQHVVEGLTEVREDSGQVAGGRRLEATDGIGGEVGEQVVGELRRAVAQGQEVADLGDELSDGAGERRTALLGQLVQEEGQRVVGGIDDSCGRGGRQPRPGRVQDDVGAGLGAEEHP